MQGFVSDFLFSFLPFYDLCAICPDSPKQGAMRLTEGVALLFFFLSCVDLWSVTVQTDTLHDFETVRKANRPPCSRRDDNNKKRESATSVGCFLLLFFNISLKSQKKACRLFFLTIKMSWYGLYQQQSCSICKIKTSRKLKQLLSARLVFTQSSLFERFKKKKKKLYDGKSNKVALSFTWKK